MLIDPAISFAVCLPVAALLTAAAAHKASAPGAFFSVLRDYQMMPRAIAPAAGSFIIAAEFAVAAGLLAPAFRTVAATGAATLFAIYAVAIGVNLLRGRTAIDCGCNFGGAGSSGRISLSLVLRNGVLAAAALTAALPVSARTLDLLDYFSVAFFVVAAAVLYLTGEFLRANAARFGAMESVR